jgi:tetraacyldisaccharide 4'-kinase
LNSGTKQLPLESAVEGLVFGFCGVGNSEAFFNDLRRWQVEPAGTMSFRDHHRYSQNDAAKLTEAAHWADADAFVTTEKDEQNLTGIDFGEWPVYVAVTALEVKPEKEFYSKIQQLLSERRGAVS